MPYEIKTIKDVSEVGKGNIAEIGQYNWGGEYRPYAQAKLCYVKDKGFVVELMCKEKKPRALCIEQNKDVCKDSCLEFFANFKPDMEGMGYVNFECNVKGSLLCCYGTVVYPRKTVMEMGIDHPNAVPFQTEEEWGYSVFIPLSLIESIYGNAEYKKGDYIRGNFFKCGDHTETPHYGSYTVIDPTVIERPSFHQPAYFADMKIVE